MFVSYAQNFEDVLLWRALGHIENGFYVDIGAQDPVVDSISLSFYERGWRGVHVEPTPEYAQALRVARPDETIVQVAIGDERALIPFFEIPGTGISTGDAEIAHRHEASGFQTHRIEVPCIKLSVLLDGYKERDIHWMKIDVEGMEQSVLRSWAPSSVRPWVVVVEATLPLTSAPAFADWDPVILDLGYQMVYFDGLNRFYVSDRHPELEPAFTVPPNVFDDFSLSGAGSHPFCEVPLVRHRRALDEVTSHAAEQQATAQTALADVSRKLDAEAQQSRQLQAEASRQGDRATAFEARLADAINREKDLVDEVRSALAALQAAALTQREDRARASALKTELRASEMARTNSEAENLRLQSELSERVRAWQAEIETSERAAQRSAFEAERRLAAAQTHAQELESRVSTLRRRHEDQVQLYLDEISRANARVPPAPSNAQARFVHVETSPIVATLFRLDISAVRAAEVIMDAPIFTRTNFQPVFAIRKSGEYDLDDFLVLHDRTFVRAAYLAILHRPADPDGEAFYLGQVRAGEYKSRILDQILRSEEAKAYPTTIRGLREHLRMLRVCRLPIVGRWIAAVLFLARIDEHLRELRGFENHVIRIAEEAQLIHEANITKLRSIK